MFNIFNKQIFYNSVDFIIKFGYNGCLNFLGKFHLAVSSNFIKLCRLHPARREDETVASIRKLYRFKLEAISSAHIMMCEF